MSNSGEGAALDEQLSDTVACPSCNGTGEIERPSCSFEGCDELMIRQPGGSWTCPIHFVVMV